MKKITSLLIFLSFFSFVFAQQKKEEKPQPYDKEKASYVLGYSIGKNFSDNSIEVNVNTFIEALKKALEKQPSKFTDQESMKIMQSVDSHVKNKREAISKVQGEKNMKEATEFLKKNKSQKGVLETNSGLQYLILKEGKGAKPKATDTVKVHYVGTLLSGKEFDSSLKRGTPAEFGVNQVIPGWTEALQLMTVGSKYKLFIPPKLAYGEFAPPGSIIEKNSLLVFEVELLDVVTPKK